ncbi:MULTISPECIES: diguanylate cyclase [unclassified Clostridium]|uniref:GGDEF domain-containing protein n=1 Tax=unclassified Clostridium TaxID=2614128 RepID=UPI0002982DB1|nr:MULTISPECIES: diguanylate cyclase [unclassified Clostridium]EKQ58288.1 MAG: diguanylate cyclase (GGDEF) domain-containing protein [Clostridium sp. Maddingley MBC34-26]
MEVKNLLILPLSKKEKKSFTNETIKINVHRAKMYSKFIISIEIIMCLADIFFKHNYSIADFNFNIYLALHLIMLSMNLVYLLFLSKVNICEEKGNVISFSITSYVTFMMIWGAIISLMEQKIYGQVMVYMINVIIFSVVYYIDNKNLLFSYFISAFVLFFGLPFFQESKNIILDHYINGIIFLVCSYITSRILYKNLYNDFISKRLIMEANDRLKNEIEESKNLYEKLEKTNKMLKRNSLKDELTNIHNRRALREFIDNIFIKMKKKKKPISVIMIDIDDFKLYNDKYGHVKGDEVLKKVSKQLKDTVRDSRDFVARYGGEEFIFISLETDRDEIYEIANKIRERVNNLKIVHEYSKVSNYVTISLGTATVLPFNENSVYDCIKNADIALYQAKFKGKNRIVG